MKFQAAAWRAHDPKWSFTPLSGDDAAVHGGRFNPQGVPALYLGLSIMTAVREANQGFAFKLDPCVLCEYAVDCDDVVDLRDDAARGAQGVAPGDLAGDWMALARSGAEPPSWALARRLVAAGAAGALVPSFAPGADDRDHNLVLWRWSEHLPHRVTVHDPSGRLPKNQLSWR